MCKEAECPCPQSSWMCPRPVSSSRAAIMHHVQLCLADARLYVFVGWTTDGNDWRVGWGGGGGESTTAYGKAGAYTRHRGVLRGREGGRVGGGGV